MFLFCFQVEGSAKLAGEGGREHQELSSESFIGGWKSTDGRWTWNRTVLYTPHRCLLNAIPILHSSQCSWSAIQLLVSYLSSEWCPWQDLILFCFDLEFLFTVICSYLFFFPPTMPNFCFFAFLFSLSLCSAGTGLKIGCSHCSLGSQKCCYQNWADLPVFCEPLSSTSAELGPESKQNCLYFAYQENSTDGFDFKSWTDKDWLISPLFW